VRLEAADLLGRLRDGWTRPAVVLVDAAEPRQVHDRFHDGLRLRWECRERAAGPLDPGARRSATVGAIRRRHGKEL
jgi:hypothetical protein